MDNIVNQLQFYDNQEQYRRGRINFLLENLKEQIAVQEAKIKSMSDIYESNILGNFERLNLYNGNNIYIVLELATLQNFYKSELLKRTNLCRDTINLILQYI